MKIEQMKNYFLFLLLKNTYLLQNISFASYIAFQVLLFFTSLPHAIAQPLKEQTGMSKTQMSCLQIRTSLLGLSLVEEPLLKMFLDSASLFLL